MGRVNTKASKAKIIVNKTVKSAQGRMIKSSPSQSIAKDKIKLINKTATPTGGGIAKSKKDKIFQKRKNLMNKFMLFKKIQKEEINRKNREKTAVIGDLKPLKDALPSLDEIFKLTKNDLKTGIKEYDAGKEGKKLSAKQKIKQKKEKFANQVNSYQKLLQDPDFKKNPRDAIRFHIQYTHGLVE